MLRHPILIDLQCWTAGVVQPFLYNRRKVAAIDLRSGKRQDCKP